MQREIEVKARVKDFEPVLKKLGELGCQISEPVIQNDTAFIENGAQSTREKNGIFGKNVLRIRRTKGKVLFTLKRDAANELDCIEREVEVSDAEKMMDVIKFLGFKESIKINKIRRKCEYNGYEICLDEVEDLGPFIEVEKLCEENEDGEKVQEELFGFLKTLGIDPSDRVMQGYDTLLEMKNMHQ